MEQDILEKFEAQDKKLEAILKSAEKMRRYFLISLIINVAVVVLPLIGLAFIIPWFLNIFSSAYGSLLK